MPHTPHNEARKMAVCHAMGRHSPVQSDWRVEVEGDLSTLTSEQMREAEGGTEQPLGLTFKEDDKDIYVQSVEIPEQMRGMGIGTQLYMQALQYAKDNKLGFKSGVSPDPSALRVYTKLMKAGIPLTQQLVEMNGQRMTQLSIDAEDLGNADLEAQDGAQ
jgi:predicted GNAT family acetyltransferase